MLPVSANVIGVVGTTLNGATLYPQPSQAIIGTSATGFPNTANQVTVNDTVLSYSGISSNTFTNLGAGGYGSLVTGATVNGPYLGVSDLAGNRAAAFSTAATNSADLISPAVTSVTSTATTGSSFKAGSVITIKVNFNEPVNVVGTPTLALNSGGSAVFASGSGTSQLTFSYVVGASDAATALDYSAITSLLAGTSIKDTTANNSVLTLATPGAANSINNSGALVIVVDTTPPTVTSVVAQTFVPAAGTNNGVAGGFQVGNNVFYKGSGAGSLQLHATVADTGGSGLASVTFGVGAGGTNFTHSVETTVGTTSPIDSGAATYAWTSGGDATDVTSAVTVTDAAANVSSATTITFKQDATAPSTSDNSGGVVTPRNSAAAVTLSPLDTGGSGVAATYYTTNGTPPAISAAGVPQGTTLAGTSVAIPNTEGSYTVKYFSVDNVGNAESVKTGTTIVVDKTSPTITSASLTTLTGGPTFLGSLTGAASSAATGRVYYKGSVVGGGFKLSVAAADTGGAGLSGVTFLQSGAAGSFTHTEADTGATTPAGSSSTVVSANSFVWTAGGETAAPVETATFSDAAGNTGALAVTLTNDTTGPSGGVFSVNGTSATGGGSSSFFTGNRATGLTDLTRTDFSETQNATQSGLAGSVLTVDTGTLSGGSCTSYTGSPSTITGQTSQTGLTNNTCYKFVLTGTDNVVNTSTLTTEVKVDDTAPTGGAIQANSSSSASYISATTVPVTVTNYADAGSGMASNIVTRYSGSPTASVCPAVPGSPAGGVWDAGTVATITAGNDAATLVDGTCYYWRLVGTNNGSLTAAVSSAAVLVDTAAPTVTAVSATNPSSSTYGTGTNIDITVTFSEPVNVVGASTLALNTTPSRSAAYQSGTGTSTITYRYTVLAGDSASRLDYTSTSALSAGTSIRDFALNDAVRTLPAPGSGNLFAKNFAIVTAPVVSSVTTTAGAGTSYFKAGQTVTINVNFNTPVDVVGSPLLTLNSTPAETATCASGTNLNPMVCTYTVVGGDTASALDYAATGSLGLNSGTIKDNGGSHPDAILTLPAPSTFGGKTLVVDTTNPAGGTIQANGSATDTFKNSTTVGIAQSNYTDTNLSTNVLKRFVATIAIAGTCPAFGSYTLDSGNVTLSAGNDTGTTTGNCYVWQLLSTDLAGNSASVNSAAVLVDTTNPTGTSAVLSNTTAFKTFAFGSTAFYNPNTTGGSFDVTGSSTDSQSGILSIAFPAAFDGHWSRTGAGTSSGSSRTYTLDTIGSSSSGSQTVTATNNATGTANATFTLTPDSTAPGVGATAGVIQANGSGTASYSSSQTVGVTFTNYADAGAGIN